VLLCVFRALMIDGRDDAENTLPPLDDPAGATLLAPTSGVGSTIPAPPPAPTDDLCGRTLQHFKVLARIGEGGMGCVYRAHDLSLDRFVALKVIAGKRMEDSTVHDRFLREARAQARLTHPNVVQIYYIGEQDGLTFFAMELVEGATLEEQLRRGERLDPDLALEQLIAVASALKLAHERGFIHRDIKPSNLLLDPSGAVKVADFGLAKPIAADVQLTQEGTVMGSPLYMSPEQGQGDPTDFRADIYSLGATFYHLLLGRPPFSAETPIGVITKHITQPLPPVRSVLPAVPAALATILERMMAKDRARRYQSYDELLAALAAARPQATSVAGVWVRAMALATDLLLLGILGTIVPWINIVAVPIYFVGGWWRFGQTIGKWLFRLRVRTLDDQPPSLARCATRLAALCWGFFALVLVCVIAYAVGLASPQLGTTPLQVLQMVWRLPLIRVVYVLVIIAHVGLFIWTGLRRDRRAPHDRVSGTMVVYYFPARSPARRGARQ
jgi:uncharacterized RDD family membrane protein YckC